MKTNISVSFKFKYLSQELNSREVRLHWTKWESGDNRAEVSEEDTFKWRLRRNRRRRRGILNPLLPHASRGKTRKKDLPSLRLAILTRARTGILLALLFITRMTEFLGKYIAI